MQSLLGVAVLGAVALAVVAPVGGPPGTPPAAAQDRLPEVEIHLIVEIQDAQAWRVLYQEVLGTPRESPRAIRLGVAGTTGGNRWLAIGRPSFATEIKVWENRSLLRVAVSGKISGTEALRSLGPFEDAVLSMQVGAVENRLLLSYGLADVPARVLELYLTRN